MIPLWQILGWDHTEGHVDVPDLDWIPEAFADRYVTTDHLLDWLAEKCTYAKIERYGSQWLAWVEALGHLHYLKHDDPGEVMTWESVVRQVHEAIGDKS